MSKLLFTDKVVVITGAGGGLGKQYALAYAQRGAKVVVNDLGGSLQGDGGNSRAADIVVEEIKKAGGIAVANYDSVEFGERIIETAVKNFGTVHIIINNAGILRDSSFKNMAEKDFKLVLAVHLHGAYKLTRAAWSYLRDQKYGRILNTASPAGLFGNFGQANYSLAKSALIGFGETLAKEGERYNIKANIIAPLARSRMTEDLLPKDMLEKLGPEKIVPLVLYLTHDTVPANGDIFEVAAGFYGQIRWQRSSGELFKIDESFTPEAILVKFKDILKFEDKPFNKVQFPTALSDYNRLVAESAKFTKDNDQGSTKVSLKGKVVIVTGAGNGLGRAHALLFGKYGAKVVVNDIQNPDGVVAEINNAGGEAVGNKSDVVTDAEGIVKSALDAFGRVDVLVNNAGILRDRSFLKMTDAEWNQVMDVHVLAPFRLSKLVWPLFLKQKSGTIINMTSTSGLYGSFGQANYAAAKCGIIGFTKTLAIEGAKHGIRAIAIAPHAETAMTKTIFKEDEYNKFDPSQVSPFVVLVASDAVNASGMIFEVGAGWVGNTRWQTAHGAISHGAVDPEFVRDHWNEVTDFTTGASYNKTTQDSTMSILGALSRDDEDEDEDEDEDDEDDHSSSSKNVFKFTERDSILYNLGLGAKAKELQYVYESSPDFQVLPSFGVIPFMDSNGGLDISKLLVNFNPALLLHGEQYLRLHKFPLPTSGSLRTEGYPVEVQNKGDKAAVVVGGFKTYDADTGELIFYNESTTFVKKAQAAKGSKKYEERPAFAVALHEAPSSKPDFEVTVPTSEDQAAIYRLSGDYNPLHIDPKFAAVGKFPRPILHGLAFFGISVKQLYEKYGPFKEVKVRFTNVVFPGEHLKVKAWKKGDKVTFQTWSVERNVCVISNAALTLGNGAKL